MMSANSILVVCLLAQLAAGVLISDGQVRLVGGETPYEGTVEIYLRGEWGTICDDRWGIDDAKVVCRMLGHQDVADAWQRAHFGRGTGEIWLDDVECVGNEYSLLGCTTSDIGVHDCTHSEDAGVSCIPGPTTPAVSESIQTTPAGNRTSACGEDPSGSSYRGTVDRTISGRTCQMWTAQEPHEHTRTPSRYPTSGLGAHNYCRNVGGTSFTAWCYTTDPEKRWEYCPVGDFNPECMDSGSADPRECYADPYGTDYRGNRDLTRSGLPCQVWSSQSPHEHTRTPERYPDAGLGDHNLCRNPDQSDMAWCYTTSDETRWEYCDIGYPSQSQCAEATGTEIPTPTDDGLTFNLASGESATISSPNYPQPYDSNTDITWMVSVPEGCGMTLRFDSFSTESNYDKFTISDNPDFSDVADEFSGQLVPPSANYDFSSAWIRFRSDSSINSDGFEAIISARCAACNDEDPSGSSYRGTMDATISGRTCQVWTAQEPHEHNRSPGRYPTSGLGDHNYCRNVGGTAFTAWCYTTDPEKRWEYCPIGDFDPDCMESGSTDPRECYVDPSGTDYRGNRNYTRSGLPCQMWTSQSPHEHTRTPENYPDAGLGDHNQCRNPDQSDMAWCYTTSDETRWEYCDIGYPSQSQCAETSSTEMPTTTDSVTTVASDGRTFNLESGESATISSPNYPRPYDSNTDITWTVSVPEGCGMNMRLVSFSTESTFDKLTIADNPDFSGAAGEFSGTLDPTSYDYDFSSAWIKFRSDSSITLDGFEAVLSARCPEVTTVAFDGQTFNLESGESVTISSPNYPQSYDSNTDISWMVSVPEGCGITLDFASFSTESTFDRLTIADNRDFSGVADEFSGSSVRTSTDYDFSSAWIRFHSDSSITSSGFEAVISARCADKTTMMPTETVETNVTIVMPTESVADSDIMCSRCIEMRSNMPGFPGYSGVGPPCVNFPSRDSVSCPQSGSCKFMNITSYLSHPMFGNVTITQLERGCSEEGMPPNVCLTPADLPGVMEGLQGSLEASGLTFQGLEGQFCTCNTGDFCNEGPSGVVATTSAATTEISDGRTFILESGDSVTIFSPNYPQPYDSSTDITWMVSVPEGCGMNLRIVSFSTERTFDELTIADNPDFSGAAGEFSGTLDPTSYDYDFSSAWIRFYSDSSITSDGFEVVISARCTDGNEVPTTTDAGEG
ncbi:uncharacterized protein [Diadema antillarum]|uniref:uncharacterized protein n=1 Tax=Diadema antillarum TaxID=105358 RepID=UPI003A8AE78C